MGMNVAVIPARGGSKRIPGKNIKNFCGQPMIAWSIKAAFESGVFDYIMVSTDDARVTEIARSLGAEVPFIRPAPLSDDHTPTVPVIRHAIDFVNQRVGKPEFICCIYATAPFILAEDLVLGLELLKQAKSSFAFSATSFPFPVQRAFKLPSSGRVEMFQPEHALTRSQDLEHAYHDAGQFYWGTYEGWQSDVPIIGPDATALLLPRHRVQDIDTLEDWTRAERMFEALKVAK